MKTDEGNNNQAKKKPDDAAEKTACKRVRETLDAYQLQLLSRKGGLQDLGRVRSDLIDAVKACVRPELLVHFDKIVSGG